MKRLSTSSSFAALCTLAALALSGCAGSMSMPDTNVVPPADQFKLPTIHGSNFGGHAPIEGAEIYVLQAGTGGYQTSSTSDCDANCSRDLNYSSLTYAATTAADGSFTVSGDYACTGGLPVYLVAAGGYQTPNQGGTGYGTGPLAITAASSAYTGNFFVGWTNTITITANNLLYPGQQVTIAGLSGGTHWNEADVTATVVTATTTNFTYTVDTTGVAGEITGTPTLTNATATVVSGTTQNNPAIVNIALLGNCPSGTVKNFGPGSTDSISYVYMNEVATAAAATALSAFGKDAFDIAIPNGDSLALKNIQNAANNANQLYDIQGSNVSGTFDGEGHIANYYTPGSYVSGTLSSTNYGIVDQKKLDTFGNILASCVDSTNTYFYNATTDTTTGTSSAYCLTLFHNATSTGVYSATTPGKTIVPQDIATAAFNIAHHPSGAESASGTFGSNLFALQVSPFPFYPAVDDPGPPTTIKDFTIGITYHAVGLNSPQGIAIDAAGDVFITNDDADPNAASGHTLVGLSPLGVPLTNSPYGVPGSRTAALDTSGNLWSSGQDSYFYEIPIGSGPGVYGTSVTAYSFYPDGIPADGTSFGLAIDNSGNVDVTSLFFNGVFQFSNTGVFEEYYNGGLVDNDYVTIAPSTNIWTDSNTTGVFGGNYIVEQNTAGVKLYESANLTGLPEPFAVDNSGTAWVPVYSNTGTAPNGYLYEVTAGGTASTITSGGLDGPSASAIDGSGNIWVANQSNTTVSEFTSTGTAITGTYGYRIEDPPPGGTFDGGNVAIDGSGDVWLAYNGSSSGYSVTAIELIGAATPAVTPLVTATKNSDIGKEP